MSRAYRVRVSESLHKVVKAEDHVKTQLEILEILDCEETAELLKAALEDLGFEETDGVMLREQDGVVVEVDHHNGIVTVRAEAEKEVDLKGEAEGRGWDDVGESQKATQKRLREQLQDDLNKEADSREEELQKALTDKLERELEDIRAELAGAVNEVTKESLKRKASRMGQIKEVTEDADTGSMTIVLEV